MEDKSKEYFGVPELAKRYGVAPSVFYDAIKRKQVKALRLGKAVRVPADEVERISKEGIASAE